MYPKAKRGKSTPEIRACKAILRNLLSKKYERLAWIFYDPIEANYLGLDDYHKIVKTPMDLSIVKKRLHADFYSNALDFASDVRLIFHNTYLYTSPDHLCFGMAKKLEKIFEDMYAEVPLQCSNYEEVEWSSSSSELDVETVKKVKYSRNKTNNRKRKKYNDNNNNNYNISSQVQLGDYSLASAVNKPQQQQIEPPEVSTGIAEVPMTAEEDLDLLMKVQQLDGLLLLDVFHIIRQLEGTNFMINKDIEFNPQSLKVRTKRSILAYVASKGITGKRDSSSPIN